LGVAAVCIALGAAAPAAAYQVDPDTRAVILESLRDFDACQAAHDKGRAQASAEACLDALRAYVKEHPKDAFEAGKRARLHYMHWVALDFFAPALREKASKARCTDEDVTAAVVSALSLPPHFPAVAQAKQLVSESCRGELDVALTDKLRSAGSTFRSNTCPLLISARAQQAGDCAPLVEAPAPLSQPTPHVELSGEAQRAAVPRVREAPPKREETAQSPSVRRLARVFPAVPAGEPLSAPPDAIAELRGLDWKLLNLDAQSAEVLRGTHGEELVLARTKPGGQKYVLIKFNGVRGPWNARVLVAVERSRDHGKDYVTLLDGRENVVLIERQRQYQAFPKGVTGGVWLNPTRPGDPEQALPVHKDIDGEFAAAAAVGK
jgi:hypothetical protein